MLQSVLGSKTLSGHNDRNLRMRTWVRSAIFVPGMLCSILKVFFFWDTLYILYNLILTVMIICNLTFLINLLKIYHLLFLFATSANYRSEAFYANFLSVSLFLPIVEHLHLHFANFVTCCAGSFVKICKVPWQIKVCKMIQGGFFYWFTLKMTKCQTLRKF